MTWNRSNTPILSPSVHTEPGRHLEVIKEGQSNLQPDPGTGPGAAAGKVLRDTKTHEPTVIRKQLSIKNWQYQQLLLTNGMGPWILCREPNLRKRQSPSPHRRSHWQQIPFLLNKGVNCGEVGNRKQWWEDVGVRMGVQTLSWGGTEDSSGARWDSDGGP